MLMLIPKSTRESASAARGAPARMAIMVTLFSFMGKIPLPTQCQTLSARLGFCRQP
jgi:hypothetical protein